jgi:hypothetical protein
MWEYNGSGSFIPKVKKDRMRKDVHILWTGLVILTGLSGLVLLIGFNAGFDTARALADFLARDGSADPFTPTLYQRLRLPVTLLGVILLALCAAMLFWKRRSQSLVSSAAARVAQFMARFWRDARTFAADLRAIALERREILFLAGILLLALAARLAFIMQPFKHDEAYTVTVFANQPLWGALSDYHLPNNHLFHTLLVHLTYSLFGYSQWAVRLPALLAGLLNIPALYLLSRTLHGRSVAVIATASAAAVPVMIDFAVQARGYTLIILFSLLLFILGIYVRRHANRFAWALIVVLVVLGIYTIPIFYFSYASFLVWLGLGFLFGDIDFKAYGSRWHFVAWLAVSVILTVLFTVLVYLPPVVRSGLDKVLPYQVADPLTYPLFLQEVEVRLAEFLDIALVELPMALGWIDCHWNRSIRATAAALRNHAAADARSRPAAGRRADRYFWYDLCPASAALGALPDLFGAAGSNVDCRRVGGPAEINSCANTTCAGSWNMRWLHWLYWPRWAARCCALPPTATPASMSPAARNRSPVSCSPICSPAI